MNFKIISNPGEPTPEDKKLMVDGLLSHHAASGHPRKTETHTILAKDEDGATVGMALVSFLWNGMKIESLWVEESLRGKGVGSTLLSAAEKEGRERSCDFAYTDTFTWQAPEFYKNMGYEEYGKLEDFPKGSSLTYFRKDFI